MEVLNNIPIGFYAEQILKMTRVCSGAERFREIIDELIEAANCFPTEVKFESCQLCPREKCHTKQAPYDPGMVKKCIQSG